MKKYGIIANLEKDKQYLCNNDVISFLEGQKNDLNKKDTDFINKYVLNNLNQTKLFKKMIKEKKITI